MKTYTKNYIGKGKAHETLNIVKITLNVAEVLKYQHKWEGEQYITFEVAAMQQPDRYGRTHTVYVSVMEKTEKEPKKRGRKPKAKTEDVPS